jgi:hypothetical protein
MRPQLLPGCVARDAELFPVYGACPQLPPKLKRPAQALMTSMPPTILIASKNEPETLRTSQTSLFLPCVIVVQYQNTTVRARASNKSRQARNIVSFGEHLQRAVLECAVTPEHD